MGPLSGTKDDKGLSVADVRLVGRQHWIASVGTDSHPAELNTVG